MIDVWSKRGIVLLNISPMANGTINNEQRNILAMIGKWISKHREAVYETRAHSTFGYGEAAFEKGHFGGQSATISYSKNDIRFTVSKDKKYLYVYSLGLPTPNAPLEIRTNVEQKVKRVSVIGSQVELKWSVKEGNVLILQTPDSTDMDELATVFRIEFEK
jgi:alpha-L-fucosidase